MTLNCFGSLLYLAFFFLLLSNIKMLSGKVSLNEVRAKLANKESPMLEWFKMMTPARAGGEATDWIKVHDEMESRASSKNLCYMLTATILVNAAHEVLGKDTLRTDMAALVTRARRCQFKANREEDRLEAIQRMIEAGTTTLRIVNA